MRVARRLLAVLTVGAAMTAVGAAPVQAQSTDSPRCSSATVLSPKNEVRTPANANDPTVESVAFGAAAIHINGTTLRYAVVIVNPARETFILGHIHTGAPDINGPVLVHLFEGSSSSRLFTQFESVEIPLAQAEAICGDLDGHYINYHTTADPVGAVRGQLR